ncbi:MAG TPA: TonB-dependent receptor [Candidatus Marinimicrobia bacterium]|nr:TonB-dependent receptor [Candidatus Neomarinimicrobiota bacterium]
MRILKPITILCVLAGTLFAGQTGKIAGRVIDSQSGEALAGCNVLVQGTSMGAATDANGEYFIINLSPGPYDLAFSMIGYASYTAEGVSVSIDVTTPVNAALTTEALQMAGVSVTAERPAIENTLTSSKHIVSGDLVTSLGVTTVKDVVKTLPGVTELGGKLHLRGGRSGEEMYLVDGASLVNPIMGGEAIAVNPNIVGELQLITGTFNAEYGQAMSGLFNIVLKEADDGIHMSLNIRNSMDNDYIRENSGDFAESAMYAEASALQVVDDLGNYTTAIKGTDYSLGGFGGNSSVMDFSGSVGMGGLGLIVSMRQFNDPGRLPGLEEDFSSIQGKLTFQLGGNIKLGAEFMTLTRNGFYDPSYDAEKANGTAGAVYVWDWIYALEQFPRTKEEATQFGASLNYVLSPSTNITLRFDNLSRTQTDGAKTKGDDFVDFVDVIEVTHAGANYDGAEGPNHTKVMEDLDNANAWFNLGNVHGHYFDAEESHTTLGAYLTSQLNARHLVKAGFEMRNYSIKRTGHDVWFGRTVGYPKVQNQSIPEVTPVEMAAYVQDQMEFNDMILNVGLRYDMFNTNADLGNWDNGETIWDDQTINPFDPEKRSASEAKTAISPRLGVSFPVGDNMAFRYAYGSFFQRPLFFDLLDNYLAQMDGGTESGYFVYMGNANLDPQKTTIYEMGAQYSMDNDWKMDVSTYYKDISNLVSAQEVFNNAYVDSGGTYYGTTWTPGDPYQATHFIYKTSEHFGNVKGVEVSVSKSAAEGVSGRLSYTYSIAQGTASDKFSAGSLSQADNSWTANIMTLTTLDWHRPYIMNGYLDYHTNMGGLISRVGGNITFNSQSGLPVTARSGVGGAKLDKRAPSTTNVNLRVDAQLALGPIRPTIYLLVENVLDTKNVIAIADPSSYFDSASNFHNIASGPTNNLMAYGPPMTMHIGVSIDY